jgi:CII-binding regulator of phage lambda lysogenization HflD
MKHENNNAYADLAKLVVGLYKIVQEIPNHQGNMYQVKNAVDVLYHSLEYRPADEEKFFKQVGIMYADKLQHSFKPINITLKSIDLLNYELSRQNPIFIDQIPQKLEPNHVEKKGTVSKKNKQSDKLRKEQQELTRRFKCLNHNAISPFRDKQVFAKDVASFALQAIILSADVPIKIKLIILFILSFYLSN